MSSCPLSLPLCEGLVSSRESLASVCVCVCVCAYLANDLLRNNDQTILVVPFTCHVLECIVHVRTGLCIYIRHCNVSEFGSCVI